LLWSRSESRGARHGRLPHEQLLKPPRGGTAAVLAEFTGEEGEFALLFVQPSYSRRSEVYSMNFVQRMVTAVAPRRIADAIEKESRSWVLRCPECGTQRSLWDAGGIRYGGSSSGKRVLLRCSGCGK